MGRYYSGDIQGKFWFGVQSSSDADYFGVEGVAPSCLEYYFDENNLPEVEEGIENCKKELGDWEKKIDKFFKEINGYNDQIVEDYGFDVKTFNEKLEWYARLKLGKKIYKCIKEIGSCQFEAEI